MTISTTKSTRSTRHLALALAAFSTGTTFAFLSLAMPARAHAAAPAEMLSEVVRYHDLDLATDADAAKLHRRIHRAARRVCNVDASPVIARSGGTTGCLRETARRGHARAEQRIATHRASRSQFD